MTMPGKMRGGVRAAVAAAILAGVLETGCAVEGHPEPANPTPSIPGPEKKPRPSPPWTAAELVHHQCVVLGREDLVRFGFGSPEQPGEFDAFCRWRTLDTAPAPVDMYFVPEPWYSYPKLEQAHRGHEHFRTLRVEGRSAFLVDERNYGGYRNCRIWVAVPSGGTIHLEYAPREAAVTWDVCGAALEIATLIAQRVR
ncbi:DUF3558 domain-containing protein [Nocardia otitidiscaviarum]|nr:DUF3558 domain-containing protein [Nocardia otitidiscaviarum]MBF6485723.1 DUF3558 domain-containing protein [Nocardia otitidiscaviarum]